MGLTKAGLYHYIPSKELLLFGIMNYAMDRVYADVIDPARQISIPEKQLRVIVENYANLIIEAGPNVMIVVNEEHRLAAHHLEEIIARRRNCYEFVRDTIEKVKNSGHLVKIDAPVAALSLFGIVMWLALWYRPDGRLTREQVIGQITELTVARMLGLRRAFSLDELSIRGFNSKQAL